MLRTRIQAWVHSSVQVRVHALARPRRWRRDGGAVRAGVGGGHAAVDRWAPHFALAGGGPSRVYIARNLPYRNTRKPLESCTSWCCAAMVQ